MRGYFGVGMEGISKPMNFGAILRTSHAFGAHFTFTIAADYKIREVIKSDTSHTCKHMPHYAWKQASDLRLPKSCQLVGVELTEDAIELPDFKHPLCAAYIVGREKGSLSSELIEKCHFTVKIPTKFCLNVGLATALVLYDRMISFGR